MSPPTPPQAPWFRTFVTCEEVITFLLSYLSGELSPEKEQDFERHLAVCPSCVSYMKTYKATVELGKSLREPEPSAPLAALAPELVKALLEGRPAGPRG